MVCTKCINNYIILLLSDTNLKMKNNCCILQSENKNYWSSKTKNYELYVKLSEHSKKGILLFSKWSFIEEVNLL